MSENYIVGASIGDSEATAWFNSRFRHSMPLSLNLLNRAIIKNLGGEQLDITVTNKVYWLREANETAEKARARHQAASTLILFPVLFLFYALLSFWPAVFIAFYVKERECRAKLLQFICGANQIVYWASSLFFDYTIFMIVMCLLLGKVAVYEGPPFSTFDELSRFLIIFGAYGFSILPFAYFLSYLFTKPSSVESAIAAIGLIGKVLESQVIYSKNFFPYT